MAHPHATAGLTCASLSHLLQVPSVPRSTGICCFILNIFFPGIGSILAGLQANSSSTVLIGVGCAPPQRKPARRAEESLARDACRQPGRTRTGGRASSPVLTVPACEHILVSKLMMIHSQHVGRCVNSSWRPCSSAGCGRCIGASSSSTSLSITKPCYLAYQFTRNNSAAAV